MTKPLALRRLGLASSEKQTPQVVENLRSGGEPKEALERVAVLRRQMLYPPELRALAGRIQFDFSKSGGYFPGTGSQPRVLKSARLSIRRMASHSIPPPTTTLVRMVL